MSGEQDEIRALLDRYGRSLEEGNLDAFMENWRDDGIQLPSDGPNNHGPEAIRAAVGGELKKLTFKTFRVEPKEINVVTEDTLYAWGAYHFFAVGKEEPITLDGVGKFLTVFRRDGSGPWKLYRDCFSWMPREDT